MNWIRNSEKRKWCIHSTAIFENWFHVHMKGPYSFSAEHSFFLLLILLGLCYSRSRPCCMWWWRSRAWWSPAWSRTRSRPTAGRPYGPSGLRRTSWLGGGVCVTRTMEKCFSSFCSLIFLLDNVYITPLSPIPGFTTIGVQNCVWDLRRYV